MAQWLVDLPPIECASGATGCAFRHNFATVCNEKCFEKPSPSRALYSCDKWSRSKVYHAMLIPTL